MHYSISISDINGRRIYIPYIGDVDRDDLAYIYRNRGDYCSYSTTNLDIRYSIQASIGGENYFRVENGVHIPLYQ